MGVLSPLFLLAGLAAAVPIILHLFHRHDAKRIEFPAIRYLLRTEKEHARNIRFRQILLLVLRTAAILLLVLIGARPFLRGGGGVHEPTALVIVLDNSMSSGRVVDGERVLETLRAAALQTLDRVSDRDEVWILRSAEPWATAFRGPPEDLRAFVEATDVSAAGGNVRAALHRARLLVEQSGLPESEIHLISDGQPVASGDPIDVGDAALVVLAASPLTEDNRYLDSLSIGGGLAPLSNERSSVSVLLGGSGDAGPVRLVVDGRIRGAVSARPGDAAVLPFGPFTSGWITGFVETDPDALAADDRRYFSVAVRPAAKVSALGPLSFFLDNAVSVLSEAGRIELGGQPAEVTLSVGGAGLSGTGNAVVVPDADGTTLPALNRRLAAAGVPWRLEPVGVTGEATLASTRGIPVDLTGVRVTDRYRLAPQPEADTSAVLARLSNGDAWIVAHETGEQRTLIVGSAFEETASSIPTTAAMVPLLDWMLGSWGARSAASVAVQAGAPIPLPTGVDSVVDPAGVTHAHSGPVFEETRLAGVYDLIAGDTRVGRTAVNPPGSESMPGRVSASAFRSARDDGVRIVDREETWARRIFVESQGPEIAGPLLWAALLLILAETFVAAAGTAGQPKRRSPSTKHDVSSAEV